ncbi:uncharacterized protein C12orf45 homolog isoform X2 [Rhinatrema bivittatum]|uniref:uncharacterized protein C12orf45 homolog isoform X2 n=1 Tax=Rhinatrema bivittatum TaxID=194408 RepID=UPI001126EF50|nr:uncharacterized protein C12orf45 homolog isoform X2 [Rhinatrema bivittatum]
MVGPPWRWKLRLYSCCCQHTSGIRVFADATLTSMTRDETGAVALYSHCVKMEGESGGPEVSRELLSVGCGTGLHEKLLINSKHVKRKATTLPIVKIPRSSVLDRVQQFLPQMARANEELTKEMATAPAGHFNIETIEDKLENIIEMVPYAECGCC